MNGFCPGPVVLELTRQGREWWVTVWSILFSGPFIAGQRLSLVSSFPRGEVSQHCGVCLRAVHTPETLNVCAFLCPKSLLALTSLMVCELLKPFLTQRPLFQCTPGCDKCWSHPNAYGRREKKGDPWTLGWTQGVLRGEQAAGHGVSTFRPSSLRKLHGCLTQGDLCTFYSLSTPRLTLCRWYENHPLLLLNSLMAAHGRASETNRIIRTLNSRRLIH